MWSIDRRILWCGTDAEVSDGKDNLVIIGRYRMSSDTAAEGGMSGRTGNIERLGERLLKTPQRRADGLKLRRRGGEKKETSGTLSVEEKTSKIQSKPD